MGAIEGDLLLLVADEWDTTCEVLGQLRNDIGRPPVHQGPYKYVWVTEFPLFIGIDPVSGRPRPGHHPFCQPHPDDMSLFETEPLKVRALAYDLVLNGWELGSGSIRIHEPEMQRRVFNQLGISDEEADKRFGFFCSRSSTEHLHMADSLSVLIVLLQFWLAKKTFVKSLRFQRHRAAQTQ